MEKYKKARLDVGLTQLEVTEKIGVAQAQYARWENGGRNPKDETVEKLAEIFGTSFEILKGRDDVLEEIVSLLREYELTKTDKNKIINTLKDLLNKSK
ncbi:hypothetical protein SKZB199_1049 [Streptococcus sp. ZB199]|nr:hypothetical protein SKZB199_1049 [Streptococcus sp. ZB199]